MSKLYLLIYLKNNPNLIRIEEDAEGYPVEQIWNGWKSFLQDRRKYDNSNFVPENSIAIASNNAQAAIAIDFTEIAAMRMGNN